MTTILEWITKLLQANVAQSSVKTYFDLLNAIMNAAVADKLITHNRCKSVRLSAILRGFSRAPKWVPTDDDVLALLAVVPDGYRAAIWLGAGEGMRLGEVLGVEDGARCVDRRHQEVHVVQQLRFHKITYGGFYLALPRPARLEMSIWTTTSAVLAEHVCNHLRPQSSCPTSPAGLRTPASL